MNNIEEDIKRCKKLTEPQNANWIGVTNQQAIAHLIARVEELEDENRIQRHQIMNVYDNGYIPKQEIKDLSTEIQKEFSKLDKEISEYIKDDALNGLSKYFEFKEKVATMQTLGYCRDKLEKLLEESVKEI